MFLKKMFIQEIQECNWDEILHIQEEAYREIGSEELNILKNKQKYSPSTCLVSISKANEVQGYLLAHPWSGKEPPKLFETLPSISDPDRLYLHDMVVSPKFRGVGLGTKLVKHLFSIVKDQQVNKIALVAVQGSCGFWANNGFNVVTDVRVDSSYGNDAVLMENSLPA
ncbi:MAG: GNAT family N-acetyltransferase [Arenicella sp.]